MTVSRIVNPLLAPQESPEALYSAFSRTAKTSVTDIKNFSNLLGDARSLAIFDRAKEVRAEGPEGKPPVWMVTEHQDWLDVRREASSQDSAEEKEEDVICINGSKEEHYGLALKRFEESHAGLETSFLNEGSNVMEVFFPKIDVSNRDSNWSA